MTYGTFPIVSAHTVSRAWLETTLMVNAATEQKLFHTVTAVDDPLTEDPDIRQACDALLLARGLPSVETVANTIFPAAMAATAGDPSELSARYREMYPRLRRFPGNTKGTYFGRLVAYPSPGGDVDQLVLLVKRLRQELTTRGPMGARYEVAVVEPGDHGVGDDHDSSLSVHAAHRDTGRRAFPCLSMCSFNLDNDKLHLLAHYRYEYLVTKGYGNYLGLARLLQYVAYQTGLGVGQMTIVSGRTHVDAPKQAIRQHLGHHPAAARSSSG